MKENQIRELVNELRDIAIEYHGTQQLRERIARIVRAALLQGSQPVSNHDELPYAQVKAVADLYALCWQSGEVVTYTPAPEKATIWLNNYSGTCVQEYVKLERLQEALAGNSPVIPGGWVMVPKKLTAENGAKSLLSGEFLETTFISCPECFADEECESCDGSGRIKIEVPVSWTTIKAIWNKGVEHFRSSTATGDN
ncbi:hypothetical protein ACLACG_000897 [Salmonella enterica subsp. enterica serovar Newport]